MTPQQQPQAVARQQQRHGSLAAPPPLAAAAAACRRRQRRGSVRAAAAAGDVGDEFEEMLERRVQLLRKGDDPEAGLNTEEDVELADLTEREWGVCGAGAGIGAASE